MWHGSLYYGAERVGRLRLATHELLLPPLAEGDAVRGRRNRQRQWGGRGRDYWMPWDGETRRTRPCETALLPRPWGGTPSPTEGTGRNGERLKLAELRVTLAVGGQE
jgi:hypothetical protein